MSTPGSTLVDSGIFPRQPPQPRTTPRRAADACTLETAIGDRPWLPPTDHVRVVADRELVTIATVTAEPVPQGAGHPSIDTSTFAPTTRAYHEVADRIRQLGLLSRTPRFYLGVGIVLTLAFAGCVAGFVLLGASWFQLLIAAAMGVVFTQIGFMAHEAAHRQILTGTTSSRRLARLLAASIGMSMSWWDTKHTRHHANPNRVGKDPDIGNGTIAFVADYAAQSRGLGRAIIRRQGWLFFPLLTLEGLNLQASSLRHLCSRGPVKSRWTELSVIIASSIIVLAPVLIWLPPGIAFAFIGVRLAVFGVYMGASFAPNHKGMPLVAPDGKLDFFAKQVRTSRNIRGGWWATILMGGLNFQIEHHLFPSMPRPHLASARAVVREYCLNHDVPYTETSLWRSYAIVIDHLNKVGLAARDPFDCPLASQLRRV